jgi:hypothetical protein
MQDDEIVADALSRYPECNFAQVIPSVDDDLNLVRVALLWPSKECHERDNPPKFRVEGYPAYNGNGHGKRIDLPLK